MKNMKKFASFILALVMVFALATTASAAEKNDSITVTSAVTGEEYSLYKLFDLEVNNEYNPTAYSYTINEDWSTFFGTGGAGAAYITLTDGYVTDISDAAALAKAAEEWSGKPGALDSKEATSDTVVFDGLDNGYYLITSTLGTLAMTQTTPAASDVTINEKNSKDTITKEVMEDSTDEYGKENDAQVGDTVYFKSTATLQPNTTNVKIYDEMGAGLTYAGDVAIEGLTKGTDYTVAQNVTEGEGENAVTYDFVITFTETYLASLKEPTALTLTYTAVLNDNAVVKDENGVTIVDQYNKTKITFGDEQSVEDQTKTTTHKSAVNKYAGEIENLAGAVFKLKKGGTVVNLVKLDDLNYRVATEAEIAATGTTTDTFTTVATGDIVIWGLDADTDYTLEEVEAPEGYNMLPENVTMEVKADNSSVTDVENKTGTVLPSTGGIGTTIFYIVGGVLVLAAVVLLVTKKRMNREG